MARLPNGEHALLDLRKIEDYCLSPVHPRGRHKARTFAQALGITSDDARWLADILIAAARRMNADMVREDVFGARWRIDVPVIRHERRTMVRTIWIVRSGEDVPRFVTCWVL